MLINNYKSMVWWTDVAACRNCETSE